MGGKVLERGNEKIGCDAGKTHQDARRCALQPADGIGHSREGQMGKLTWKLPLEGFWGGKHFTKKIVMPNTHSKNPCYPASMPPPRRQPKIFCTPPLATGRPMTFGPTSALGGH